MVVGANKPKLNKSRALAPVQRRLDLQALMRDLDTMFHSTFFDSIVKFFAND
jgi:hypothetical protein